MNTRRRLAAALAVPLLVGLGACSTSGSSDSQDAEPASGQALTDAPSEGVARTRDDGSAPDPLTRAVISTGTVSLGAEDVPAARREVQRVADAHRATIAEESTDSGDDGRTSYVRMVLRVPAARFGAAMESLEEIDHLVSSTRESEDVTTEVIDTDVRVRAQRASLERVEALLTRAERLQQIVWIESQLTQRQAELDSLLGQQRWLEDQTTLSTITVDIERRTPEAAEAEEDDDGFLAGLAGGWSALAATATVLATVVGALLPFVVVLAVLGVPVWILARRSRRRRTVGA